MSDLSARIASLSPKKRALLELRRQGAASETHAEPIAIVGIGCRFPGGADGPAAYWKLLSDGVDAVSEVPPDRWDIDAFYDPNPEAPGKMYTRWGGFIRDVDLFEPQFFGIAPREAAAMDPQQRLLLEVAWQALEHAGLPPDRLVGSRTGVFVGMMTNDYAQLNMHGYDPTRVDIYSGMGVDASFAAGRLSYVLGLQGPSMVIETACSSALVGVHLACQSLRAGECDLALAGGVNLILSPEATIYSCRIRSMAADGRCKTFDARADGYVRGEGCGVVVLKRLSEAARDGDHIWAIVRGSAINHDGKSGGLTVPNAAAQRAVLRAAVRSAGVSPASISYVEAHGTGTPLGDPIEIRSLWTVMGEGRPSTQPLMVGSAKTNLGHLEAAAGIAGLIKTVLALHHQTIPPHLHLQARNPYIAWDAMSIAIPTTPVPWQAANGPRLAGVSSFGLSGMNAHIVLEEAPPQAGDAAPAHDTDEACLLALSARTPDALRALAGRYAELLAGTDAPPLADVAAAAGAGRSHFAQRAAIVSASTPDALAALYALANGQTHPALATGTVPVGAPAPRVAFVCAGQGGQWPGMVAALRADPVAAAALDQVAAAAPPDLGWSLGDALADASAGWQERIEQLQPVLFAVQVALAARLKAWGLEPAAVVGHSFGEVAAAYLAGALSLPEALRVICARSRALARIEGQGAMAVVELAETAVQAALAGHDVSIAGVNGPRSVVVSGAAGAVEALVAGWQAQGVFARRLAVGAAAHSGQLDELVPGLEKELGGLAPQAGQVPYYSTVTGQVQGGETLDGGYWARNLREPVMFWGAVQALAGDGHTQFVELGPHPTLVAAVGDGLRALGVAGQALGVMRRDQPLGETMLGAVGALYCAGAAVTWPPIGAGRHTAHRLPTYPFQRERYWIDAASPAARDEGGRLPAGTHPLLGVQQALANDMGKFIWTRALSRASLPELVDHQVDGLVILPGAAYLEMLLAAGAACDAGQSLSSVAFSQALALPADGSREVQTILTQHGQGAVVEVFSRAPGEAGPWTRHARGIVQGTEGAQPAAVDVARLQARCAVAVSITQYYEQLSEQGLVYGPSFRRLGALWRGEGEALAEMALPAQSAASPYRIQPAMLDGCFQCLGAALPPRQHAHGNSPVVPVAVESLRLIGDPNTAAWCHARLDHGVAPDGEGFGGDVFLLDGAGNVILEVRGVRLQRLDPKDRAAPGMNDWFYELAWEAQPAAPASEAGPRSAGSWLILANAGDLTAELVGRLEARGEHCVVVTAGAAYEPVGPHRYQLNPRDAASFRRMLDEALSADIPPCRGVIYLWGLDSTLEGQSLSPTDNAMPGYAGLLHLAQALAQMGWRDAPRLWLVTRGAQAALPGEPSPSLAQAPLWGMARTIAIEHPEMACTCVDLADAPYESTGAELFDLVWEAGPEAQVALRDHKRYVARLVRRPPQQQDASPTPAAPAGDRPFRLEMATPGILDGLTLRAMERRTPGPGEVEIEVEAAGLNFLDVLGALGARPDPLDGPLALGGECAGRVTAVGADVTGLRLGDAVIALAPWSFGTHVIANATLVVPKPPQLSFAESASIPVVFLTAYYALHELGRLQPGDRVLIHSAAGGTGLAALQLAQRAGAEVLATASSAAKRDLLQSLGVRHTADSRSLAFAREFLAATGGRGVDVVLNSLTGPAIEQSLRLLAPYGRFLEIGKKDIYQNAQIGLEPFRKNLSYFAIDLARMIVERPEYVRRMLIELLRLFKIGELRSLPLTLYPIAQAGQAFHAMAQARHTGKLVLTFEARETTPIAPRQAASGASLRGDGAYLITGGLGGLGLQLAAWLVRQGARRLVLVGRRPPAQPAEETLVALRASGAEVHAVPLDISDGAAMATLLQRFGEDWPPLRGVIHAAAVLEDSTVLNLDLARLRAVLLPKLDGAWHLHTLTRDMQLDFFVLFSSAAGMLGSPGQANYAAANAFLDALAHHRRALGLPALSINWGPWAQVGLAAAQANRGERLAVQGMAGLTPTEGLAAFGALLGQGAAQAAVMKFNLRHWRQLFPRAASAPLLSRLSAQEGAPGAPSADNTVRDALLAAAPGLRLSLLETHLIEQIAQVLRLPPNEIDSRTPLPTLGLDSLLALELRNRLEVSLGVTLSATLIWGYPTVAALAPFLAEKIGLGLEPPPAARSDGAEPRQAGTTGGLDELSDEAAAALLAETLETIDREYLDDEPSS